jgi:hypothetical protein
MAVKVQELCSFKKEEAEKLLGRKVISISGWEYGLTICFEGGLELTCKGHSYEDSALDVSIDEVVVSKKD